MRILLFAIIFMALTAAAVFAWVGAERAIARQANQRLSSSSDPALEYLKAVNRAAPPKDPQLLLLLMGAFGNANQQQQGVEFLSARLNEFGPRLNDGQKALYLSAISVLRAQNAASVPFYRRIGYVKNTIAMLDKAKKLSGGQVFVVNWMSGVVRAQLPGFFHQKQAAQDDLTWCLKNNGQAPNAGWLREIYFRLAKLSLSDGRQTEAHSYLRQSGYKSFDKSITLMTPFSLNASSGFAFSSRRIRQIIPHRVYELSGFDFTEYYFVVSEDGRELIGIDAGANAHAAKSAYEALRAYAPGLPALTTIFVTHSHWDHVGGQRYFRGLDPKPRFYARSNYQEEIATELSQPESIGKSFFGNDFNLEDVRTFRPDVMVDGTTELKIGGTRIELIPVHGGETHDAMFINLPDFRVLFAGDFIMPYVGAPFVPEGDFEGLLNAIDVVVEKRPRYILQGHEALTQNFSSPEMLAQLKGNLTWLRDEVLAAIRRGESCTAIQQENLIPPGLLEGRADVLLPYLVLREHVIDRLYRQSTGYWQANLDGVDHLSKADKTELLVDYLGVSEKQVLQAVYKSAKDGKYELAASLIESAMPRFGGAPSMLAARKMVYEKLMEKSQNTDPFKYILYSGKIDEETPAIAVSKQ